MSGVQQDRGAGGGAAGGGEQPEVAGGLGGEGPPAGGLVRGADPSPLLPPQGGSSVRPFLRSSLFVPLSPHCSSSPPALSGSDQLLLSRLRPVRSSLSAPSRSSRRRSTGWRVSPSSSSLHLLVRSPLLLSVFLSSWAKDCCRLQLVCTRKVTFTPTLSVCPSVLFRLIQLLRGLCESSGVRGGGASGCVEVRGKKRR